MKKSKIFMLLVVAVLSATVLVACGNTAKNNSDSDMPQGTLEEIMANIYSGVEGKLPSVVNTTVTKENSGYFFGIENMEFEQAIASEPMMSSIAHSICLVQVTKESDVDAVKEKIKEQVDPRKWICVGVEREEVQVVNRGNLILLVIDQNNPQAFVDSFMNLK